MRIVVLDADPAFGSGSDRSEKPGEADCTALEALGELQIFAGTRPGELLERAKGAEVLLTNKVVLGHKEFAALPSLRLVSVLATGVNVVDLDAARAHGVTVCNVPGYSTASTAQHVIALLLELTNHVGLHAASVQDGDWARSDAFSYFLKPLSELDGKVMGIVGYGAIGAQVGRVAQALGMRILAHTRSKKSAEGVVFVDKETLLKESDVVSLHCPLSPETAHFIDAEALSLMKTSALLINAARGPIVDEVALAKALSERQIRGAAVDVLQEEPPRKDNPLSASPFAIVTPHIAWASVAARERLLTTSVENIKAFAAGEPVNTVAHTGIVLEDGRAEPASSRLRPSTLRTSTSTPSCATDSE